MPLSSSTPPGWSCFRGKTYLQGAQLLLCPILRDLASEYLIIHETGAVTALTNPCPQVTICLTITRTASNTLSPPHPAQVTSCALTAIIWALLLTSLSPLTRFHVLALGCYCKECYYCPGQPLSQVKTLNCHC